MYSTVGLLGIDRNINVHPGIHVQHHTVKIGAHKLHMEYIRSGLNITP